MSSKLPSIRTHSVHRTELIWLAIAVVFASLLRLSFPGRMGIEHFDEGVYASNFWFGVESGFAYPARHLYAPPLLPAAIEWTMNCAYLVGVKPTGFVPLIPGLIAGIAMIPSIWWVGRKFFGSTAGLISAWLVATSDFHASYSRAALTDVPVCLFILWGVYFFWRSLVEESNGDPVLRIQKKKIASPHESRIQCSNVLAAGIFTGLAWWTKYNGWLPIAIGIVGVTLWQFVTPPADRQLSRCLKRCFVVTAFACVAWTPVLWDLQSKGGYASVAANHRQYLVGFKGWSDSAFKQLETIGLYDNSFAILTQPFGEPRDFRVPEESSPYRPEGIRSFEARSYFFLNRCVTFAIPITLLLITGWASFSESGRSRIADRRVAACLLTAWFFGMSIMTPFYYPYPRLVLPWLTSTWLGLGLAGQLLSEKYGSGPSDEASPSEKSLPPRLWVVIVVIWLSTNSVFRTLLGSAHALDDRSSVEHVSEEISRLIQSEQRGKSRTGDGVVVCVLGEPALVFGLRASGQKTVYAVPNLDFVGERIPSLTYLAIGPQSFESLFDSTNLKRLANCRLIGQFAIRPSHLVEMDSNNRSHFFQRVLKQTDEEPTLPLLRLYQISK